MRDKKIHLKVKTLTNMLIGGTPSSFEIGGIDVYTITDFEGKPYIPASTLKGKMRSIVKELTFPELDEIKTAYQKYLLKLQEENEEKIQSMNIKEYRIREMNKRYQEVLEGVTAEYLFGISGFNQTPKLIFNDLKLESYDKDKLFSTDTKNSITTNEEEISANPRTYKAVHPNVVFTGDILFYNMEQLNIKPEIITNVIMKALDSFNSGIYRLGNSGSRGYGKVLVKSTLEEVL